MRGLEECGDGIGVSKDDMRFGMEILQYGYRIW